MRAKISHVALVGFLVVGCQSAQPPGLSAFRFDGCSCFPDGTPRQPELWKQHCLAHDHAYWQGGTFMERKAADLELRDAIRREGKPLIAQIAYAGVRIGGTPWLPTPWRWGFGWNEFPRGYREISDEERLKIKDLSISGVNGSDRLDPSARPE